MNVVAQELDGVHEVVFPKMEDERGWLAETWNAQRFDAAGLGYDWVQENESVSTVAGTLRGLHFQAPPSAQAKLVRAASGSVFSVAVDIRRSSPSFGRWVGFELDADCGNQMLVARGFAHGLVTLTANARVAYKVDAPFDASRARSLSFSDPALGIDWPYVPAELIVSAKDAAAPLLADADDLFA